jgi:hypothetical protein
MSIETILWLSYLFLVILGGLYYLWSLFFGVPYVPSSNRIIADTLAVLQDPAYNAEPNWLAVEPGAGDGRVAFALAKKGFKVDTIEIIPFLSLWIRLRKFLTREKQVRVFNSDMYKFDYSNYRIALIYLYPKYMRLLEDKLFKEMAAGSLILSNTFNFAKHKPEAKIGKLLIYRVG